MNLLIIIGNAVVDFKFRALLLKDPLGTAEAYGFPLTKFEAQMLLAAFNKNQGKLQSTFLALENQLYANIEAEPVSNVPAVRSMASAPDLVAGCRQRPCTWSMNPPEEIRATHDAIAA
jgi:hypothetical protein